MSRKTVLGMLALLTPQVAWASDFSGFLSVFIALPVLLTVILFMWFLCVLVSRDKRSWVHHLQMILAVSGMLSFAYWFCLLDSGEWRVWLVLPVLMLIFGVTMTRTARRTVSIRWATNAAIWIQVAVGSLVVLDMVLLSISRDDPGYLIYLLPVFAIIGMAFRLRSITISKL